MSIAIQLSPKQKECAEWAIEPMDDYWQEQIREGEVTNTEVPYLPVVIRNMLAFNTNDLETDAHIVWDMMYRVGTQWTDMAAEHDDRGMGNVGYNLRDKIRKAIEGTELGEAVEKIWEEFHGNDKLNK